MDLKKVAMNYTTLLHTLTKKNRKREAISCFFLSLSPLIRLTLFPIKSI